MRARFHHRFATSFATFLFFPSSTYLSRSFHHVQLECNVDRPIHPPPSHSSHFEEDIYPHASAVRTRAYTPFTYRHPTTHIQPFLRSSYPPPPSVLPIVMYMSFLFGCIPPLLILLFVLESTSPFFATRPLFCNACLIPPSSSSLHSFHRNSYELSNSPSDMPPCYFPFSHPLRSLPLTWPFHCSVLTSTLSYCSAVISTPNLHRHRTGRQNGVK